jgi:2-polyprenyl-6-hydroxyphenyl methylase/3-demethylubiquinone-9 3-methyltransferase
MTGVDAAPENIGAARAHAAAVGLDIDYVAGGIEDLAGRRFDLITSMEVIEHVSDPAAFVAGLAGALAEGGLMILSTPNRTLLSKLAMITIGEGTGAIPKGTHDWDRFLTPDELEALLADAGMKVIDRRGLSFSPARGFVTSSNEALNYLLTAVRG